jgi:hypothetical protein
VKIFSLITFALVLSGCRTHHPAQPGQLPDLGQVSDGPDFAGLPPGATGDLLPPTVSAPDKVTNQRAGLSARVTAVVGVTYSWSATGATITSGANTEQITWTAGEPGLATLTCTVTNAAGDTASGSKTVTVAPYGLELIAGGLGGQGNLDGTGSAARFDGAYDVASDPQGDNYYVTEATFNTIRRVTSTGVVTLFAGQNGVPPGANNGPAASATFSDPQAIAWGLGGVLFVADCGNKLIRKIDAQNMVSTFATLSHIPFAIAVDNTDANNLTVYVADDAGQIIKLDKNGGATTIAPKGQVFPAGIALDRSSPPRFLYITTPVSAEIMKMNLTQKSITRLAGSPGAGFVDTPNGPSTNAKFTHPTGIVVDSAGAIYVSDDNLIRKIVDTGDTSTSTVVTVSGDPATYANIDGPIADARWSSPDGMAIDANDDLIVPDSMNRNLRVIKSLKTVSTLAGLGEQSGATDGIGASAQFNAPSSLVVDANDNILVADNNNSSLRQIAPDGTVSTYAGKSGKDSFADGALADARFSGPASLALGPGGILYVADQGNDVIRAISGGMVSTLAGVQGMPAYVNGTGSGAQFDVLRAIAADPAGNLYTAEEVHTTEKPGCALRQVTPLGVVGPYLGTAMTYANCPTQPQPGTGNNAVPGGPVGLAADGMGNLYVTDISSNNTVSILQITPGGVMSVFAGGNKAGYKDSPDPHQAQFSGAIGSVAVLPSGDVYVADTGNHSIRKIAAQGGVTTVAGAPGSVGVRLGPLPASLNSPSAPAVTPLGDLLIADENSVLLLRMP